MINPRKSFMQTVDPKPHSLLSTPKPSTGYRVPTISFNIVQKTQNKSDTTQKLIHSLQPAQNNSVVNQTPYQFLRTNNSTIVNHPDRNPSYPNQCGPILK